MTRNEGEFTYTDLVELERRVADLEAWRRALYENRDKILAEIQAERERLEIPEP